MPGITLFDMAQLVNEPRFSMGNSIYKVCLDGVEHHVASSEFSLRLDAFWALDRPGHTLWRHHLNRAEREGHSGLGHDRLQQSKCYNGKRK